MCSLGHTATLHHGGPGACDAVAETWVIESHCVQGFVGEDVPIEQEGCNFTVCGPFSGLSGVLSEEGAVSLEGVLGVMELACTGTYDQATMALTCTDDCAVQLVPRE